MATHDEWIADGSASTAPVTQVTPPVAPAPDSTPAPAAAAPVPDPTPTPVAAPAPTDAAAATQGADAPLAAAGAGAPAAPVAPAAPAAPVTDQDFIDAFLDGKPIKVGVPKGASFQIKRGDDVKFVPLTDAGKAAMLEQDYRIKTAQAAERARQLDLQEKILASRNAAMEKFRQEQLSRLTTTPATPEEAARQAAFAELAKGDPFFRGMLDEAAKGRALEAEREVIAQQQTQDAVVAAAEAAERDVVLFSQQYGISPERLRERFAYDLQVNNGELSPRNLERLAKEEAAYVTSATSPLQKAMDELKAQVASLTAGQAAAAHNATTGQAIARSQNNIGAPMPSAGNPAPAAPGSVKLTGRTISERSEQWARA